MSVEFFILVSVIIICQAYNRRLIRDFEILIYYVNMEITVFFTFLTSCS
jgi:hypothetical protein